MKVLQSFLSVAGLASVPYLSNSPQPSLTSNHPASIQFSAWLSAFNTGNRETILAYHTDLSFPVSVLEGPIQGGDNVVMFARLSGGFDIAKVESIDNPSYVVVVMRARSNRQYIRANMSVDISRSTYPATKLHFTPTITPLDLIPQDDPRRPDYERAMAPLTSVRRRAILDGLIDVLREQYVNPAIVEDIIAELEENVKNGDYDNIDDNEKFSYRLTHDLHSYDKYTFVRFFEPWPENNGSALGPTPKKHFEHLRIMNFGFGTIHFDTESVPGRTIATIPLHDFIPFHIKWDPNTEEIRAAVGDRISSVADADALIVDLRDNNGGYPDSVAFIISYLLDNATHHLVDILDRNSTVMKSRTSLTFDELPPGSKCFGGTKPLFVLTSNTTIGGGEDLAYSLQAFKRAQAIIGEGNDATTGTANFLTNVSFVAGETFGKGWWFVGVPNVKPVHAVTGLNWEGVGVKSDTVAGKGEWEGEKNAQEVARQLAMRALQPDKEEL